MSATHGRRNSKATDRRRSDLAVALNLDQEVPRPAAYRLAGAFDAWIDLPGRPRSEEVARVARRLRVLPEVLARALALRPAAGDLAEAERERAAALGARLVTRGEADYPAALEDLEHPPPVLSLRGAAGGLPPGPAVAMVGSRRADRYGRDAARLFARELAGAGAVVVSGFAVGVDAGAHRGALEAAGGTTVAVLGCGLGVDYPRGHRKLADEVAERGALVSEFPIGRPPERWQFPIRNRVLASLAQAVLVVRAAARSGSLITARLGLELGRDIYALPGNIFDPRSAGPNALIRDGAFPALHPDDLLPSLGLEGAAAGGESSPGESNAGEAAGGAEDDADPLLSALLSGEPRHAEDLARDLGRPIAGLLGELLELELAGKVERLPGGMYARVNRLGR